MNNDQLTMNTAEGLKERYAALRSNDPAIRIRNAAAALGVSEVELVMTELGNGVVRLEPDHKAILAQVGTLGRVMALTRNDDVVHERKGVYKNASLEQGPVGLFVGADIDLRIFWGSWSTAFAVNEPGRDGVRSSLQFFNKQGQAIHKIYLLEESDHNAYAQLVERFRASDQSAEPVLEPTAPSRGEMPDHAIDTTAFRKGWLELKDTHDFHLLLRDHRVSRTQALRLAPEGGYAVPVSPGAFRAVLTAASEKAIPVMVFVGNAGMLQIHTGLVEKVVDARGWFNVLDPEFNLHVREEAITQCWVVRKPTTDGMVTALECFNAKGEQIVQLFGKRKPGIPELEEWRTLMADVEPTHRIA